MEARAVQTPRDAPRILISKHCCNGNGRSNKNLNRHTSRSDVHSRKEGAPLERARRRTGASSAQTPHDPRRLDTAPAHRICRSTRQAPRASAPRQILNRHTSRSDVHSRKKGAPLQRARRRTRTSSAQTPHDAGVTPPRRRTASSVSGHCQPNGNLESAHLAQRRAFAQRRRPTATGAATHANVTRADAARRRRHPTAPAHRFLCVWSLSAQRQS